MLQRLPDDGGLREVVELPLVARNQAAQLGAEPPAFLSDDQYISVEGPPCERCSKQQQAPPTPQSNKKIHVL